MPLYNVELLAEHAYAEEQIEAKDAAAALRKARRLNADDYLCWCNYDGIGEVQEINVRNIGDSETILQWAKPKRLSFDRAQDKLSDLLESPTPNPAAIRKAAVKLCIALNTYREAL